MTLGTSRHFRRDYALREPSMAFIARGSPDFFASGSRNRLDAYPYMPQQSRNNEDVSVLDGVHRRQSACSAYRIPLAGHFQELLVVFDILHVRGQTNDTKEMRRQHRIANVPRRAEQSRRPPCGLALTRASPQYLGYISRVRSRIRGGRRRDTPAQPSRFAL